MRAARCAAAFSAAALRAVASDRSIRDASRDPRSRRSTRVDDRASVCEGLRPVPPAAADEPVMDEVSPTAVVPAAAASAAVRPTSWTRPTGLRREGRGFATPRGGGGGRGGGRFCPGPALGGGPGKPSAGGAVLGHPARGGCAT